MLFLPVGITATKPLMLTHIAGIAYLDISMRLLSQVNPAKLWHNRIPWDLSVQNIRFWTYLELFYPNLDFTSMSEHEIGKLYVQSHNTQAIASDDEQLFLNKSKEIRDAIEHEFYIHPSSIAILKFWRQHLSFLGLELEGIDKQAHFKVSHAEILKRLEDDGLLIDQKCIGGPTYLDLTSLGLPLRTLVSEFGEINYLLPVLRDLYSHTNTQEKIILFHDDSVEQDYIYFEKLLMKNGAQVMRKNFFRVSVEGVLHSSKAGGWEESTFTYIQKAYLADLQPEVARLAIKHNLLYSLGQKGKKSFNAQSLKKSIASAENILHSLADVPALTQAKELDLYNRFVTSAGLVNVYGMFSYLENKRTPANEKASLVKLLL